MPSDGEETLAVATPLDVERARRLVRRFSADAGLASGQVEELVLAASELVSNIVKHGATGGRITCRLAESPAGGAVEVVVLDRGSHSTAPLANSSVSSAVVKTKLSKGKNQPGAVDGKVQKDQPTSLKTGSTEGFRKAGDRHSPTAKTWSDRVKDLFKA